MKIAIEIRERSKPSIAYASPTSPGSAPADTASTLLYQHADHLTTRVTTDNAGTLSNQQAHYPYGENWYATGTADPSVKRKFTSYRKETDSSLASGQISYATACYHGARTGRFQRPVPRGGSAAGPNGYGYGPNDPINLSPIEPALDDGPTDPPSLAPNFSQCGLDPLCRFALQNCIASGRDCSDFHWASLSAFAHSVWEHSQYIMGAVSPYGLPNLPGGGGNGWWSYDLGGGFALGNGWFPGESPWWVKGCARSPRENIVECEDCCQQNHIAQVTDCSLNCIWLIHPLAIRLCVNLCQRDDTNLRDCNSCCDVKFNENSTKPNFVKRWCTDTL